MDVAGGVDAAGGVEAVALAGVEVVGAVGGRGVDGAGAGVGGDVGGQNAEDAALEERMLEGGALELAAFEAGEFGGCAQFAGGDDGRSEFSGDDVDRAAGLSLRFPIHGGMRLRHGWGTRRFRMVFVLQGDVLEVGVEGDGHGGGEGPGGGGPDDGVDFAASKRGREQARVGGHPVAHIDGWAGVLLVLDFGFGEGGTVVDAPVDGLESAIDEAFFEEAIECLEGAGLVVAGHGHIGFVPAAEDTNSLKLRGLQVDVLLGVGATGFQDGGGGHLKFFAAELLVNLDFDGEAVAVVAGNIGRIEAGHGF